MTTLFPPVDQYSVAASNIPAFAGFHFITQKPPLVVVNAGLLTIEIIVVLVNLAITWLLRGDRFRSASLQYATLLFTGVNLVLMPLFPPMKSVFRPDPGGHPVIRRLFSSLRRNRRMQSSTRCSISRSYLS